MPSFRVAIGLLAACALSSFVLAIVMSYVGNRRRMSVYWKRQSALDEWMQRFPQASEDDIHLFLALLAEAWGFRAGTQVKFQPGDKVMDIYHRYYGGTPVTDCSELARFTMAVEDRFGAGLAEDAIKDATLGDMFSAALEGRATAPAPEPEDGSWTPST